jgi:hypothetical protein
MLLLAAGATAFFVITDHRRSRFGAIHSSCQKLKKTRNENENENENKIK